jgi:hypothetical protein
MANSKVRILNSVFPTDTSTFDVTVSGETRNPTGCVVLCSYATDLATTTDENSMSFGLTDFTTVACVSTNDKDNQGTATDTNLAHQLVNIINLTIPGTTSVRRSATVAAISGGVRFTPVQSGTAYRIQVILIFGAACKAFSTQGDGVLSVDETVTVAHGLGVKPSAGIYFWSDIYDDTRANADYAIGFHADTGSIVQRGFCQEWSYNQTVTRDRAQLMTDRLGAGLDSSGNEVYGIEMTTNNATNCIYTNRIAEATGVSINGLLIDFDDVSVSLQTVDTPTTAASDWNYNGLSFTPQAALGVITQLSAVDTGANDGTAGVMAMFGFDEDGTESSIAGISEDQITLGVTDTNSRIDDHIHGLADHGGQLFNFTNPTFTSDGFDVLAADITAMDSTVRKWPILFIEAAGTPPNIVTSVERVTVDWDATSEPVTQNLSKGQDETQCVPFFTKRLVSGSLADDFRERTMKVEMIDNGGTPAVRVSAAGKTDADDHRIEVYVVEFDASITVQQVDADITDTNASANISITDVGAQANAFFMYSYQYTHGSAQDRADYACVRPIWNGAATDSITIERTGNVGTIDGMLYVVSSSTRFSVQHRDISIAATDELTNDTITAVSMPISFLLTHFRTSEAEDDPLDWSFVADLTSTTNVRVRRSIAGASNAAGNVGVQVVTALGGEFSVQRGDFVTTSNLTETSTFSAVDLQRSFVKTGTHEAGLNSLGTSDLVAGTIIDEVGPAAYLSSNNQITWTRESVSETGNIIPWEVIQFSAGLDSPILIPTGPLR